MRVSTHEEMQRFLSRAVRNVNMGLLCMCIAMHTLLVSSHAAAQDEALSEEEEGPPISWSHREEVGLLVRGPSASSGLQLGASANGRFEFWAGWRETPTSGVSAFLSREEDDGQCHTDLGLGGTRCGGAHSDAFGNLDVRALGGSFLDNRRGFLSKTDASGIVAVDASDGAWLASWGVRQELALVLGPLTFDATVERQKPVGFGDVWWRSNRNRTLAGGGFRAPTWVAMTWPGNQLGFFDSGVHVYGSILGSDFVSTEIRLDVAMMTYEGFDTDARIVSRLLAVEAYAVVGANPEHVPSPSSIRFSFFQIASSHLHGFSVDADVSLAILATGNPGESTEVIAPSGGLRLSFATGDDYYVPSESFLDRYMPPTRGEGVSLALSSFERIDPSSFAIDHGGRIVLEADWKLAENLVFGTDLNWIVARRGWIATEPPPLPMAQGDVFSMMRANVQVDWFLAHGMALTANAYVERSDRDDTLLFRNPSLDMRNAYGANIMFTLAGDSSNAIQ